MGTTREWSEALVMGTLWGTSMLFSSSWKRRREGLKPIGRMEDVLSCSFAGVWFGIFLVFGWRRSFQMPLVVINIGAIAGALLIPRAFRRGRKKTNSTSL
jgi:hypothetical protein